MLNVGEEKGRQRAHRDANDYDTLQHPSGEDQQVDGDGGNERDQIWTGKRKRREACHAHEVSTYPGKFRDSPDAGDDEQCSQRKMRRGGVVAHHDPVRYEEKQSYESYGPSANEPTEPESQKRGDRPKAHAEQAASEQARPDDDLCQANDVERQG